MVSPRSPAAVPAPLLSLLLGQVLVLGQAARGAAPQGAGAAGLRGLLRLSRGGKISALSAPSEVVAPAWANSSSLSEVHTHFAHFADMLNEKMSSGRFQLFEDIYQNNGCELPWKGMWWRRVLRSGSIAKIFAVESYGEVAECQGVEWVLKASKSHDTKWIALKDVCIARVLASMPHRAPAVLPVLDVRSHHGHVLVMSRRAKLNLLMWQRQLLNNYSSANPAFLAAKVILFHQMVDGIQRMHTLGNGNGMVHCNISPENVMVDKGLQAFLIGFDAVRRVGNTIPFHEGNMNFMSPEYLEDGVCGRHTDIWAAGVTLYVLFFCKLPYARGDLANDDPALTRIHDQVLAGQLLAAEQFALRMKMHVPWQKELRMKLDKAFTELDEPDVEVRAELLKVFMQFPMTIFRMFRSLFEVSATQRVEDFGSVVTDAARLAKVSADLMELPWPIVAAAGAAGGDPTKCAEAVQKMAQGQPHPVLNNAAGMEGVQRCLEYGGTA